MTVELLPTPPLPRGRPNLVVTGFMGTGKTTAGREASRLLGLPFLDLDAVIEARVGASPDRIIAERGEHVFREIERGILEEAAALSGTVIATGGGAVLHDEAFEELRGRSLVAVLTCDRGELLRRLAGTGRPLAGRGDPAVIAALLEERAERYAGAGPSLDTTGRSPEDVGRELAGRLGPGADPLEITVRHPGGETLVSLGAIEGAGSLVRERIPGARAAAVVVDAALEATLGARVARSLDPEGLRAVVLPIPSGEAAKTVDVVSGLWADLVEAGLERTDPIVAVGGGSTLDAAGFAAATYARGVPLVHVPTTLLAMCDAALGGKVAVDHGGVKNLAGAFHHPRAVLADPAALATLPEDSRTEGLAEVVKMGILASPLILDLLAQGPPLGWVVEQALRIKAAFVEADPADRGPRSALNLGHTYAHAIEAASGHAVPHGRAVAAGLVAAARLGAAAGVTEPDLARRIGDVLERLRLDRMPPEGLRHEDLVAAMRSDKKRRDGVVRFVVPAPGGSALLDVPDLDGALDHLIPARRAG